MRLKKGSSIIELAFILLVLMSFVVLPFLSMMQLLCAYATAYWFCFHAAESAAKATSYAQALSAMTTTITSANARGLGITRHVKPIAGYHNSGANLFVKETNIFTKQANLSKANQPLPHVDAPANVYELLVQFTFETGPYFEVSGLPYIKDVPAFGKPCQLVCSCSSAIEAPNQYASTAGVNLGYSNNRSLPPVNSGSSDFAAAWDYPTHQKSENLIQGGLPLSPGQIVFGTFSLTLKPRDTIIVNTAGQRADWGDSGGFSLVLGYPKPPNNTPNFVALSGTPFKVGPRISITKSGSRMVGKIIPYPVFTSGIMQKVPLLNCAEWTMANVPGQNFVVSDNFNDYQALQTVGQEGFLFLWNLDPAPQTFVVTVTN